MKTKDSAEGALGNAMSVLLSDSRQLRLALGLLSFMQGVAVMLPYLGQQYNNVMLVTLIMPTWAWGFGFMVQGGVRIWRALGGSCRRMALPLVRFLDDFLACMLYAIMLAAVYAVLSGRAPSATLMAPTSVAISVVFFFINVWLLAVPLSSVSDDGGTERLN